MVLKEQLTEIISAKISTEGSNQYLYYLIDKNFQGVNKLFVLSVVNEIQQRSFKIYYLSTVEIKNDNVIIDEQNFFDQPVRDDLMIHDCIRKIAAGQGDDYRNGCLLN